MFAHRHRRRRRLKESHRCSGQAYTEFIIVLPLFLVIIAGVIGFGQALYTKLAVEAAAWSACRHAVATLDQTRGVEQALRATRYTLSGFGLNPNKARAQVTYWGGWGRGQQVIARICYDVPSPPVPMGAVLAPTEICSRQAMPIEPWQSSW